jgi:hypothetical protein
MTRLAAAFLLLAALGAWVEAGPVPEPVSLIQRPMTTHLTHSLRADQKLPSPKPMGSGDRYRHTGLTHGVRGK